VRALEIASQLVAFERRGPGTDAERRAGRWLASELQDARREVRIEPFWCRPNWALAHAWHVLLALTGSLVSVSDARLGAGLLLLALLSLIADALLGASPGRRLTPERASQNVIAVPRSHSDRPPETVRLIVTANYDAGGTGLVYRNVFRIPAAWLRRATHGLAPGWLGWLCVGVAWLLVIAVLRYEGHHSTAVGVAQLVPTVGLVLAGALLVELGMARYGPAAGDNGSGAAVALAVVRALDAAPPRRLTVELVLYGAGEGGGIGLRKHLRNRRRELQSASAAVIGVAPCGEGQVRWWTSDGPLLPLRYSRRLRDLCDRIARDEGAPDAAFPPSGNPTDTTAAAPRGAGPPDATLAPAPTRGRGATPAFPARTALLPAIAIGCLDSRGLAPRSHQSTDLPGALEPGSMDAAVEFALVLVDALDAFLASPSTGTTRTARQRPVRRRRRGRPHERERSAEDSTPA
jgi:hypothetical protein